MLNMLQKLGASAIQSISALGRATIFWWQILFSSSSWRNYAGLWARQMVHVGIHSLIVILLSGFFIGMVLALEGYTVLARFGAGQAIGQLVSLSLLRELGPVVVALLFAGRAGSSLTAEIGLMKATEQLDSMEMIGVDPLTQVIRPRLLATIVSMPILTVLFNVVAIWGAYLMAVLWLHVDSGSFWANMQNAVEFREDVINGFIKSVVFGMVIGWVAVFQGYDLVPTSEGISQATTQTVVYSSVAVLGIDFLLTLIMFGVS